METFGQSDPRDFPWQHPARPSGNFMIKGSTWMAPWIFMLTMPLPRWKPTPLKRTNFQNALCMFNIESVRIHNKQWTCWFTKPNWFCHQRIQNCQYVRKWERKYPFLESRIKVYTSFLTASFKCYLYICCTLLAAHCRTFFNRIHWGVSVQVLVLITWGPAGRREPNQFGAKIHCCDIGEKIVWVL